MTGHTIYEWEGAARYWERLGAANHKANVEWLRSLDQRASIEIFEDLCSGIPGVDADPSLDPPPVVLFKIWRER